MYRRAGTIQEAARLRCRGPSPAHSRTALVVNPAAQVRQTYDIVAEDYAASFPGTEPEAPIDLAVLNQFVAVLDTPRPRVLDAGCGTGRISRYLADRGCVLVGVDLSPGMVAMARRDHPDIPTCIGSITDLPYDDAAFDGGVYWYSMIHVDDQLLPQVFAEAARVVRPQGQIIIAFQAGDGVRDAGEAYRERGHDVRLTRYPRRLEPVLVIAAAQGLVPVLKMVREPLAEEREPQAFAILTKMARSADLQPQRPPVY